MSYQLSELMIRNERIKRGEERSKFSLNFNQKSNFQSSYSFIILGK